MNSKILEQKLEFIQIRNYIKCQCLCGLGENFTEKIKFSTDITLIKKLIDQVNEFKQILLQNITFPNNHYIDCTNLFEKIKPENSYLNPDEFGKIKLSLATIRGCLIFLKTNNNQYPTLYELTEEIKLNESIFLSIDQIITDEGNIKDNASELLLKIRHNLKTNYQNLKVETDRLIKKYKTEGYSESNVNSTIRNGRLVIPIKSEFKRKIKGFIHDESATGLTTYIEPTEILELNNTIKSLELEENREIIRLLISLSDSIRPNLVSLRKAYTFLGIIDFVRAKSIFAIHLNTGNPSLINKPVLNWVNAYHPILHLQSKTTLKKIIPLSISLNESQRILLLSGPNAGGKSVCLKTVGLLQYMIQCGIPVPIEEGSVLGIFEKIFIDIGDEQSIENDLSTYSAHLSCMKNILQEATDKSLILIDEFGTGTEPKQGAAIAESILEKLNSKKTFGIITTHYSNLKALANRTEGIINGAMGFNIEKLEPLYTLQIGKPGSSYAFEIAEKIGLPESIISASKQKLGSDHVNFETLLHELEKEKNKFTHLNESIAEKERNLKNKIEHYEKLYDGQLINQKIILSEAKEKAKNLLNEANKKIENTIRLIKESGADKETTKLIRDDFEKYKVELKTSILPQEKIKETTIDPIESSTNTRLEIGDFVKVKESGALGEIVSLNEKFAEIVVGNLRSTVKLNRLQKISKKEYRNAFGEEFLSHNEKSNFSIYSKSNAFSPTLDVRGLRGEEALIIVTQFIENAIMLNVMDLKIIHGKGDGILRTIIRNHLTHYKQIVSISNEHEDRGGAGATIIKFS